MTRIEAILTPLLPQVDLTYVERFWFGVACILGLIWFALVMVRRLPILWRDLRALFKGAFASDAKEEAERAHLRRIMGGRP
jgi:hypothetical protein